MSSKKSPVIFKKKKTLSEVRQYVIRNCRDDFGMSLDVNIAFDADPPRKVLFDILEVMSMNEDLDRQRKEAEEEGKDWKEISDMQEEESRKRSDIYYNCATQLILDTDLDGLLFDTAQETEESFEDDRLPIAFLYNAVGFYLAELFRTHDELKKIMMIPKRAEDSGNGNLKEEEELAKNKESE